MPFTLSHAAAALPLRYLLRGAAVFPALVIGCFIPDVPYFLPAPLCDINVHHLPGLLLFGIPCGWTIYILWFGLLLDPTIAVLPSRYGALLSASRPLHCAIGRAWPVTLSLLAGAFSHIVWDAFTHRRGLVVHAWPALTQPVLHVGGYGLPPYFVLQHASTLVGMVLLALHVRNRLRDMSMTILRDERKPQLSVRNKILVTVALSVATIVFVWYTFSAANAPRWSAYNFVCCTISAGAAMTVIYALAWHAHRWRLIYRARR